jgi:hypothetical protein
MKNTTHPLVAEDLKHLTDPLPLNLAARCLRVPMQWLRDEITSGNLPALVAGKSVLVHVPTVAAILVERAKGDDRDYTKTFVTAQTAAARLGVPKAWIEGEAKAGRIKSLHVGQRRMFCVEVIERQLIERMKGDDV